MKKANNISIVITSFNDFRAINLIKSLRDLNPFEIIIADGGSKEELVLEFKKLEDGVVKFYSLLGNIAETRYQVQTLIKGDITVFVDTDEEPKKGWLKLLTNPIENERCDFTFGSTVQIKEPTSRYSKYLNNYDSFLYDNLLEHDILKGAMGNSAWKTEIIRKIGFDPCLGIGGEDYDLTIRAVKAGFRGVYVKDAVLGHDQNSISTFKKFTRKIFYNYLVGASLVYRKNNMLFKRSTASVSANAVFKDPLEIVVYMLKPLALIFSLMINPWEDPRYCSFLKYKQDNLN